LTPIAALLLAGCVAATSMQDDPAYELLFERRHCWYPYPLPREHHPEEIERMLAQGFDTVGLIFVGPYNGGDVDWSVLDEYADRLERDGRGLLLHICPRFNADEGVCDTLSDGRVVENRYDRNPNYAMCDVFDPAQREKFCDYVRLAAERYGSRAVGLVIGWGYQGETGFYNGDFNSGWEKFGSECAGYSQHALEEFNRWRRGRGRAPVDVLPLPSTERQSDEYIDFMRFRLDFVSTVFHYDAVDAASMVCDVPVGLYGYWCFSPESYARNWCPTPNADFYRSAGSAGSFDSQWCLVDSGIGWEEAWMHDGGFDNTAACMIRDEARQMAHGSVFHAMYCRVYDTEDKWEEGVYEKVCRFLLSTDLPERVEFSEPSVGLFSPTWSVACIPSASDAQPFLPREAERVVLRKMAGTLESFGLPYERLVEEDLYGPSWMSCYDLVVVPMAEHLERFLPAPSLRTLRRMDNVFLWKLSDGRLTRSRLRRELASRGLAARLDYEGDDLTAGLVNDVLFNWTPQQRRVRLSPGMGDRAVTLGPHEWVVVDDLEWDEPAEEGPAEPD